MTDSPESDASRQDWFAQWLRTTTDAWSAMGRMWSGKGAGASTGDPGAAPLGSLEAQLRLWTALQKGMGDGSGLEAALKVLGTLPDLSLQLLQTAGNGFSLWQSRWIERLHKMAESGGAYDFRDLDREFLNRWTEVYRQEFQKFFKIPQLGLTRFHQEKINAALDRYNLFLAAASEFVHLMGVPVTRSIQVFQNQLAEMAEKGTLPEDSQRVYQLFIRVLEGHFMTLFQSPEYTEVLAKAIAAMNDFLAARQEVMETFLRTIPLPTQTELDELYREIYLLKKRIRVLEEAASSGSAGADR